MSKEKLCGPDPESDPKNRELLEQEGILNPLFMAMIEKKKRDGVSDER